MTDAQIKHLEMLQGVITRMGTNSFLINGWAITVVSALVVLAIDKSATGILWVGLIPISAFWGLDAYYLWQEKLFRALYDLVRESNAGVEAFSMKTSIVTVDRPKWFAAAVNRIVAGLYAPIVVIMIYSAMYPCWVQF